MNMDIKTLDSSAIYMEFNTIFNILPTLSYDKNT